MIKPAAKQQISSSKVAISGKSLQKTFKNEEKPLFSGINLEIKAGSFVALTGPSGCGKSTLLRILAGLEEPDSGSVFLNEKAIFENGKLKLKDKVFSEFRREKMGFIFQSHLLIPELTVLENVALPLRLQGKQKKEAEVLAEKMLGKVNLEDKKPWGIYPETLSVGEQQRVGIARALIHKPKLVFADEPTASLDDGNAYDVLNLLKTLQGNKSTILMITHTSDHLEKLEVETVRFEELRIKNFSV